MSDLPPQLVPDITVQDAIHGRIWLTRLERRLINTPEFQRLRHITQLGLADYVFPTATHSRLAHSLGAAHVMGWMLRQQPLQDYFSDRPELIPLLRLAALLHDLGHYPFSHLGERVYGAIEYGALNDYGSPMQPTVFDIAAQARVHARASHEMLTARLIRESQLAQLIRSDVPSVSGRDPVDVLVEIIEGTYTDSVCHSLISSDLDCDRLDYLVRDASAAGLAYGQVDLAYLIENLRVENHPKYGPVLAVDFDHGFGAVEHYLHTRYFHYARFITHKTIASAELLLAVAMLELVRVERLPSTTTDIAALTGTSKFLGFVDAHVWDLLHKATTARWASPELKEASRSLINRTLLKCAYVIDALEHDDDDVYEHVQLDKLLGTLENKREAALRAGVQLERFCYKKSSLRLTGVPARVIPKPGEQERYEWIQTVNVARKGETPTPIVLMRGLLQHLSTRRWVTRRVFVREPSLDAQEDAKRSRRVTRQLHEYLEKQLART